MPKMGLKMREIRFQRTYIFKIFRRSMLPYPPRKVRLRRTIKFSITYEHPLENLSYAPVQYSRTEWDRQGYTTLRLTGSPIARDLQKYTDWGVKFWQIDSIRHDPSLFVSVRLSGSPIARDLEKYTEVFTEGVECWRIDSIGYRWTRPVSLFVGSTEQSPIARET